MKSIAFKGPFDTAILHKFVKIKINTNFFINKRKNEYKLIKMTSNQNYT